MSDLASLPYVVVDVFAEHPFAGNPLAVVVDAEGLSGDQMLQITREFNLSETAFPLRPTEAERAAGADYVLRIFTPGRLFAASSKSAFTCPALGGPELSGVTRMAGQTE